MGTCSMEVSMQTINGNMEEGWATTIEEVIMADNKWVAKEEAI